MSLLAQTLCWNGSLLFLELLAFSSGAIGLVRTRWIENVPFANPVAIASIDERSITLADGRTITPDLGINDFSGGDLRPWKGILGIEPDPDHPDRATIHCRRPQFVCGLGQPLMVIPLITYDRPRYTSVYLGEGTLTGPTP